MSRILIELDLRTADAIVYNSHVLFASHCSLSCSQIVQCSQTLLCGNFIFFGFLLFLGRPTLVRKALSFTHDLSFLSFFFLLTHHAQQPRRGRPSYVFRRFGHR